MGQKPVPSRFKSLEKLVFFPKICPYFALDVERSDDAQDLIRLYGCKGLIEPFRQTPCPVGLTRHEVRHLFRIGRTRRRRRRTDDIVVFVKEFPHHLAVIFIGQDGKQEDPLTIAKDVFISLAEGRNAGRIMGAVEDDVRISGLEDLKAAGPLDVTDAVFKGRPGQFFLMACQEEQRHDGSGAVGPLVFP